MMSHFMEITPNIPRVTRKEEAKELGHSKATFKRHKEEMNMTSSKKRKNIKRR